MPDLLVADLSRWQFALTAMYHFLFVPLTLGLSMMLVVMEGAYVMTGKEVWKKITRFWATLFGINFVLGVATGITMEFQFGTNWAYYSHYVGDIFGAPLAIEGLMAFFLEATFLGVLLAYGIVAPLAGRLKQVLEQDEMIFHAVKQVIIASLYGHPQPLVVESARSGLGHHVRPGLNELLDALRGR